MAASPGADTETLNHRKTLRKTQKKQQRTEKQNSMKTEK